MRRPSPIGPSARSLVARSSGFWSRARSRRRRRCCSSTSPRRRSIRRPRRSSWRSSRGSRRVAEPSSYPPTTSPRSWRTSTMPDLLEPLQFSFMQRALLGSIIVGVICAVVGVLVVLRGLAFLGDAVAHAAFPGIVIAFLLKTNLIVGGMISGVVASISMGVLVRRGRVREDTAIGVIFAGMFALGIVLFSRIRQFTGDLLGILLGNVLSISADQLVLGGVTGLVILVALRIWWRELIFVSFDAVGAQAAGLHVFRYDTLLLALIGLTVAVSVQLVGIVLVVAMLVTPPP